MAKRRKGKPQVLRFRVLSNEHALVKKLAEASGAPDVSTYFRRLIEREWAQHQQSNAAA